MVNGVIVIGFCKAQADAATWKVRAYNADDFVIVYVGGIEVARATSAGDL